MSTLTTCVKPHLQGEENTFVNSCCNIDTFSRNTAKSPQSNSQPVPDDWASVHFGSFHLFDGCEAPRSHFFILDDFKIYCFLNTLQCSKRLNKSRGY